MPSNRRSKTRTPLPATRRAASSDGEQRDWIGSMSGTMEIRGDIISPVIETPKIKALKS
jgi:hypothetical protein